MKKLAWWSFLVGAAGMVLYGISLLLSLFVEYAHTPVGFVTTYLGLPEPTTFWVGFGVSILLYFGGKKALF